MKPTGSHEDDLQKAERIAYLIAGHLRDTLTEAEGEELDNWILESDENLALFEKLTDEENIEAAMSRYLAIEKEKAAALQKLKEKISRQEPKGTLRTLWPYLVAASLALLAVSIYVLKVLRDEQPDPPPSALHLEEKAIPGGTNKAVLQLSDGRTVILDSAGSGELAKEGGVKVRQEKGGKLLYQGTTTAMQYNQVSTPRGGQYAITLADGTRVWLNAESSLRFPAGFATASREVELKGEAYFEVAKAEGKSFQVKFIAPDGEPALVEVLGTHFNVNGYGDDGTVRVTLVEGSVQVSKGGQTRRLEPGEAAGISRTLTVQKADVREATAWKEGRFLFRDATVRTIGEQLRRWYDVEVSYKGQPTQLFNTEAGRDVSLQQLLEGLRETRQVSFELKGRHLLIKPYKAP